MSIRSRIRVIININKIIKKGILLEFDDTSNLDITCIAVFDTKGQINVRFLTNRFRNIQPADLQRRTGTTGTSSVK